MKRIRMAVLRGVCQIPAYVAYEKKFFHEQGLDVGLSVAPTAWTVPERLIRGECHFAVMPWTRVAAASAAGEPLLLICGSGYEEAAIVIRKGLALNQVKRVAVPLEGGIKDLTAMALMKVLGWEHAETLRQPSGDGAILALVGQGADAASLVEPYATMLTELGIGEIVKRTGDMWPGAPGCSLSTNARIADSQPDVVQGVVTAFLKGAQFTDRHPEEAAGIAHRYIGVNERFIREALRHNRPNPAALENRGAMEAIIGLMTQLGYLKEKPTNYVNLSFLARARETLGN